MTIKRVCIVGASGKLGQTIVQHALDRGYAVVGVCREQSVAKLDPFKGRTSNTGVTELCRGESKMSNKVISDWRVR